MEFKDILKNYKLYAFIMGIIIGTAVYNILGTGYSFSMFSQVKTYDFWNTYIYLFVINLRFWIFAFVISFFKFKNKILVLIIFVQAFVMSGMITMAILSKNMILLYGVPMTVMKIISSVLLFDERKPIVNKILSVVIFIIGTAIENIFIIKF